MTPEATRYLDTYGEYLALMETHAREAEELRREHNIAEARLRARIIQERANVTSAICKLVRQIFPGARLPAPAAPSFAYVAASDGSCTVAFSVTGSTGAPTLRISVFSSDPRSAATPDAERTVDLNGALDLLAEITELISQTHPGLNLLGSSLLTSDRRRGHVV